MPDCLIAFGSNQGNSAETFDTTIELLRQTDQVTVLKQSQLLKTAAVGGPKDQDHYLNAAIAIATTLPPEQLHRRLIEIETQLGRVRTQRWGSRTVDLDLLLFGELTIQSPQLTVPHPRMSFRRFVLEPANEISGDMIHVTSGLRIDQLLAHLNEKPNVIASVCLCNEHKKWLETATAQIPADWKIQVVQDRKSFEVLSPDAKLVTYFSAKRTNKSSDTADGLSANAAVYPGPTLALPQSADLVTKELTAAVEAMKTLDRR